MNATVVDRLLPLVLEYAEGRAAQKTLRRAYVALRCEEQHTGRAGGSSGEPEPAEDGQPPCYQTDDEVADWCATCRQRDPLFGAYRARKLANRALLARLETLALKLTLPDAPPAPEEPKLLLQLMGETIDG